VRARLRTPLTGLVVLAGLGLAGCGGLGDEEGPAPPQLGAQSGDDEAAEKLGFPGTATKNTIRIGGGDPAADVAGAASAVFPASSERNRPNAVVLVDSGDWQGAVAAAVLGAAPINAPMLLADGKELPAVSRDTLNRLDPKGSDLAKDSQVIRIGDVAQPEGRKSTQIAGRDPYERAAAIDRFSTTIKREPSGDVIVASGEQAEFALPAAAWATRSGDSVLLTERRRIPPATAKALRAHDKPNIYVLGPVSVISSAVEKQLKRFGSVRRIAGKTAVQNAIEFARYQQDDFGWGVTVPGHNLSLASTSRPLDAAAAATLAANGVFAPALLTDNASKLPRSLESYLLDIQPGYEGDPGEGVYNRVWIVGDDKVISIAVQGRIDEITSLVPVEASRP